MSSSKHAALLNPVERFEFDGEDCLYRDHRGRRVVADWEGPGFYRVLSAGSVLLFNEANISPAEFSGPIADFAAFVAIGPGEVQIEISRFPFRQDFPKLLEVPLLDLRIDDESALKACAWKVQNCSDRVLLTSSDANGGTVQQHVISHLNAASVEIELPQGTRFLRLEKEFDAFHGRQRARVQLDGVTLGIWYIPRQDRRRRWQRSAFVAEVSTPSFLLQDGGGGKHVLRIDPVAGSPLWSVGRMWVSAFVNTE